MHFPPGELLVSDLLVVRSSGQLFVWCALFGVTFNLHTYIIYIINLHLNIFALCCFPLCSLCAHFTGQCVKCFSYFERVGKS